MDLPESLLESVLNSLDIAATKEFERLGANTVGLFGRELGRLVDPDENPGLFSPIMLMRDGKEQLGALLAMEDRVLIAWQTGTFRIKNFEAVFDYSAVHDVETGVVEGGLMSKDRDCIEFTGGGENWFVIFPNIFEGGGNLAPLFAGMISGALKPRYAAES